MKDNLLEILWKDKEDINSPQVMNILEIFKEVYLMDMGLSFIQMEIGLKELIKMEKRVVKELIILNLEKNLLENGSRMKEVEREL